MKLDKNCKRMRGLINEAVDGFISESDLLLLDTHIKECPDCRKYREEIEMITSASSSISFEEPAYLESKIMAAVNEAAKEKAWGLGTVLGIGTKLGSNRVLSFGISFALVLFAAVFLIYTEAGKNSAIQNFAEVPVIEQKELVSDIIKPVVQEKKQVVAKVEPAMPAIASAKAGIEEKIQPVIEKKPYEKDVMVYTYKPAKEKQEPIQMISREPIVKSIESNTFRAAKTGDQEPLSDLLDKDKAIVANNMVNPLRGDAATIQVKVEETALVRVVIYDKRVRVVSKLIDENKEPGIYEVQWFGKNDSSDVVREGVYYVFIQIGTRVIKKKIIVVK